MIIRILYYWLFRNTQNAKSHTCCPGNMICANLTNNCALLDNFLR